jgi:uncharacterized BrkB/YihY/UPF0761 family membrane protein
VPPADALPPPAPGRIARWRTRAEAAADHYQRRAQTRPLLGLPLAFLARYTARQGILLASATAFRLFLWLLPLALIGAGLLAGVAGDHEGSVESASKVAGVTGAASREVITALRDGHRSWWVAVALGVVLLLWTTRTLIRNLVVVNAHLWAVPVPRARQKDLVVTVLYFAGGWLVIVVANTLLARLRDLPAGVILALLGQTILGAVGWLILIRRLPDRRRDGVDLLPGAVLFGFGLAVLNLVSQVYLPARFASSSRLYGSLGIAGVILAWMLIIGQLVVSSILVNVVWAEYRAGRKT